MATRKKPAAPAPAETETQTPATVEAAPAPAKAKKAPKAPKAAEAAPVEAAPAPVEAAPAKPVKAAKAPKAAKAAPAPAETAPEVVEAAPAPVVEAAAPAVEAAAPAKAKKAAKAPKAEKAEKAPAKRSKKAAEPEAEDAEEADEAAEPEAAEPAAAEPEVPPAPKAPYVEPLPELPDAFGADRIVVMARDPESAFIYWELTPDGVGRARSALGASAERAQLVLRLYRGEGDAATAEDHPVRDWLGRHTWHADRAGQRLAASIGFIADGVFVHVTQAAPTRLPRRAPGDAPVRFVRVGPKVLTRAESAPPPAASGVRISYTLESGGHDAGAPGDANASPGNPAGAPAGSRHLVSTSGRSGGVR